MTTSRLALVAAGLILLSGVTFAQPAAEPVAIEIPALPLNDALKQLARQAGFQVVFYSRESEGMNAPGISGKYTAEEALRELLAGTGLKYEFVNTNTVAIRSTKSAATGRSVSGSSGAEQEPWTRTTGDLRLVQSMREVREHAEAQQSAADSKGVGDSSAKLEEILVTATKREERLQDVPASITAISGDEIARRGLTQEDDYMRAIPGVSRFEAGTGRSNAIIIRGLAVSPELGKPTAGTYFGEVPLVSSLLSFDHFGSADVALVDIERVEVLKGPQGTLYGSGALAGIVRTRPMAPNLQEFAGYITAGYSNSARQGGNNHLTNGVLNIPLLKDKLAIRAVGYHFDDSGFVRNVAGTAAAGVPPFVTGARDYGATLIDQDNVGHTVRDGGRVAVLWRATDDFDVAYNFLRQNTDQTGMIEVMLGLDTYEQAYIQNDETAPRGLGQNSSLTIHNLELNYGLSWARIMSSSSWIDTETLFGRDITNALGVPLDQTSRGDFAQFAQEVRIVSSFQGPWQFLVGGFYEDAEFDGLASNRWTGDTDLYPFALGADALPLFAEGPSHTELRQKAVFGEVSFEFLDKFEATVGGRGFSYEGSYVPSAVYLPAFGLTQRGFTGSEKVSVPQSGEVFKAGLSYQPSENSLLYGQWSEGFRLGSPADKDAPPPAPNPLCDPDGDGILVLTLADGRTISHNTREGLQPDTTNNYELGGKFLFLNGRARVNAAVYSIDWKSIPISIFDANGVCTITANAGLARSQGVELETMFRFMPGLEAQFGMSYVDAKLTVDAESIGGSRGDRLPGSPRFTANAGVNYDFSLLGNDSYLRANLLYVGEFFTNLKATGLPSGDYHQVNIGAGMTFGPVLADLYVNNLTDSDDVTWVYQTVSLDGRAFRLRPRTIGARMTWNF